jgi:hypothetical protein
MRRQWTHTQFRDLFSDLGRILYTNLHKMLLSVSWKSARGDLCFLYRLKWNNKYARTLSPHDVLEVKKVLEKSVLHHGIHHCQSCCDSLGKVLTASRNTPLAVLLWQPWESLYCITEYTTGSLVVTALGKSIASRSTPLAVLLWQPWESLCFITEYTTGSLVTASAVSSVFKANYRILFCRNRDFMDKCNCFWQ